MREDHQKEMIKMFEHGIMTATSMNHQMVGMVGENDVTGDPDV